MVQCVLSHTVHTQSLKNDLSKQTQRLCIQTQRSAWTTQTVRDSTQIERRERVTVTDEHQRCAYLDSVCFDVIKTDGSLRRLKP